MKPQIQIKDVRSVGHEIFFEAVLNGYEVPLLMSREFVEDFIGSHDPSHIQRYFEVNATDIQKAAHALAYLHSTHEKAPGDMPGPVSYLEMIQVPFSRIQIRKDELGLQ